MHHRHIIMTPMERAAGRLMRAPDHPTGDGNNSGGDSGSTENNPSSNSGDSNGNVNGTGNNSGQPDELSGFWQEPAQETTPNNESNDSATQGTTLGQTLLASIDEFAPSPVFTDQIAAQIGEGNFEGVNEAIATQMKSAMRQQLQLTGQMLQPIVSTLLGRMQEMVENRLGSRDNEQTLLEAFPSAADPRVRPMIQGVFEQALRQTKGDRPKAVELTRSMLKVFGQTSSQDLGLEIPPNDREGGGNLSGGEQTLIDELLGRS